MPTSGMAIAFRTMFKPTVASANTVCCEGLSAWLKIILKGRYGAAIIKPMVKIISEE